MVDVHRSHLCRYLRTRSWADLKRAYEESAKGQLMDELITLRLEKTISKTPIQVPGMPRHVAFKHVSTIPAVIGHEFFIASELRADAPVFVPAALKVQTKSSADTSVIGGDAGPLASQTQDGTPEVSSVRQENERQRPPPTTAQKVVAYRLLCAYRRKMRRREETRVRAARVLQAGYRRLVAFRSLADLDRTRQNFFLACVDQGRSVLFPSRASRRIYYGALPHVLTALDVVISHLESVKSKVKQEFAKQDHLRLEAMSDRLTEVKYVARQDRNMTIISDCWLSARLCGRPNPLRTSSGLEAQLIAPPTALSCCRSIRAGSLRWRRVFPRDDEWPSSMI